MGLEPGLPRVPLGQARKNRARPQEARLDSTRAGEQGGSDHSPRPGPAALPEQSLLEQGHPLLHPGPRAALRLRGERPVVATETVWPTKP